MRASVTRVVRLSLVENRPSREQAANRLKELCVQLQHIYEVFPELRPQGDLPRLGLVRMQRPNGRVVVSTASKGIH